MNTAETYITLTETDKIILQSYSNTIISLGQYLGEGYEIILHSLENLQHSVIEIVNGHYSGRKKGAPITDLALSMLSKITEDKKHAPICYMNRSKKGVPLRSSTIPIFGDENRIIGLLCINFYTDIPFHNIISKFMIDNNTTAKSMQLEENYSQNTDELIETVLLAARQKIMSDASISSQNKNKEIIIELYNKGIFNIKDSVNYVADLMGISKNTVYMHIRNLKDR